MANILYRKQKQQKSLDNGVTWIDTGEYRVGDILENPSNCTSDDSKQCRWVELPASEGYYCDGYNKYTVQVEECTENGIIWTKTGNQQRGNTLIANNASECGYVVLGECDLKVVRISIYDNTDIETDIEIKKDATDFILSDEKIEELELYNTKCLTYVDFRNNSDLYKINTNEWVTDNLEYFRINNCGSLTFLDLSSWNTSNLNYLSFGSTSSSNKTLGCINFGNNFDTSNITNMAYMFGSCYALTSLDLSNWNTSSCTNMNGMFDTCSSLREIKGIENFDTSNVTSMDNMFQSCRNLYGYLDLSGWNTNNLKSMSRMFEGTNFTSLNLSGWNTSNFTMGSLYGAFGGVDEIDISGWDLSNFELGWVDEYGVFSGKKIIATNCNQATIDKLIEMGANEDNIVVNETLQYTKKYTCTTPTDTSINFTADISYMYIDVNETSYRFESSTKNDDGYYIYDVEIPACAITTLGRDSSNGANNLLSSFHDNIITITNIFDTTNVFTMTSVFSSFINLKSLNLNNFNTSNVTTMDNMFFNCSGLTSLDLSSFDTSNVTDMHKMFRYCRSLTSLDLSSFDTSNVTDMNGMFDGCYDLTSLNLSGWNTSNLINVNEMFYGCFNLTELNVTGWDISKIENYTDMFYICNKLNKLILGDVEPYEFAWWCARLTEANINCDIIVSNYYPKQSEISFTFEVPNIFNDSKTIRFKLNETEYSATTANSIDNGDGTYTYTATLEELNIDLLTSCKSTFSYHSEYGQTIIKEINNFPDTSIVTNMANMFYNCSGLTSLDLSSWNVSSVMSMDFMFENCSGLISLNLSNWNTSNVTDMTSMFDGCRSLTSLDLSSFDTSKVTSMVGMFGDCSGLTSLDVSNFNTSNVTYMNGVFNGCSSLTSLDVSSWNISNVTQTQRMFKDCTSLRTLKVKSGTESWWCARLTEANISCDIIQIGGGTGGTEDSGSTTGNTSGGTTGSTPSSDELAFAWSGYSSTQTFRINGTQYTATTNPYSTTLSDLGVSNFTSAENMFSGGTAITAITSIPDTSNVTNMYCMFYYCSGLTSLNISGLDTSNVTDMKYMFSYCSGLTTLDLSSFNTSNVTDMSCMFQGCSGLTSLDLSTFNTSNVTNMSIMFHSCKSLTSLDLSNFNTSACTNMGNMFRNCTSLQTLDVSSWDISGVSSYNYMFTNCTSLKTLKVKSGTESWWLARLTDAGIQDNVTITEV